MTTPVEDGGLDTSRGFHAVQSHIESGILDGTYPAGAQLPPERELAANLGTSRGAVREAIRALQAQGLITSSTGPGRGTRVSTGQGTAVGHILRLHLALGASSIEDMTETRVSLERSTTQLAARNIRPEERARLIDLCEQMDAATDADAFNVLDTQFHVVVARAGGNRLGADLTVAIREALRGPILQGEQGLGDWPAFRATLVEEHRRIANAILAGDGDDAARIMEEHIRRSYRVLLPHPRA
jgi:GntR family transcriptional repressor for pyruvate dehydrogenase complex